MPGDISGWHEVRRKIAELGRASVRAGVVGEASYRKHSDSDLTIGDLAIVHELGLGVPERSFVRSTLEEPEVQAGFVMIQERLTAAVVAGRLSRDVALRLLGEWVADKIRTRILKGEIRPPLSPRTIQRKGFSIPLLESGELADAIGWEIDK